MSGALLAGPSGPAEPPGAVPDFVRDVLPILTRYGCNAGSCHGAQHGKGGFRLSLLGYDPEADYRAIVHESEGRRISPRTPDWSLLLLKPSGRLDHGGKVRFAPESTPYATLRAWIAAGAPPPPSFESPLRALRAQPATLRLREGESARLRVRAEYAGGLNRDVTDFALLETLDDAVATVDGHGTVQAEGPGETAIMVRFQGEALAVRVAVPFVPPESPKWNPEEWLEAESEIDRLAARKWLELGLVPSPRASDGEIARRLYLDLTGTLPEPEEVEAYIRDPRPDPVKRPELVDKLLESPAYVSYWTLKWGDLLRNNRKLLGEKGMWSLHLWLRESIRTDKPLDEMVRELITARGSTFTNGAANYYRVAKSPEDLAETTAQVFLGVRLQCARCHHHPFERWSQDDYYGLAAFFTGLRRKRSGEFGVYGTEEIVYVTPQAGIRHPRTGRMLKPRPPGGPGVKPPGGDPRRALAEWITSSDNPFFARNLANRLWGYLMGRGLVEPLDDQRETNPASNPELLDALARILSESGFQAKALLRAIATSRVYALSAVPHDGNRRDGRFYSRRIIRRLAAEVLLDAISQVTGSPERFKGLPEHTRAVDLPDASIDSYFLSTFGKPKREIACECERTDLPNLAQALHLMNGELIERKIRDPNGRVTRFVKERTPVGDAVRELYLAAFSRLPRPEELERAEKLVAEAPSAREGLEDLLWSLLNSTEFLFNH